VFDDYFTSTKVQTTNLLPHTWNDLFTHNHVNILDGEPEIQQATRLLDDWEADKSPALSDYPTQPDSSSCHIMSEGDHSLPSPPTT